MQTKQSLRGVTLIELLISMTIIGVLGAIAYPSYRNYTLASHRIDAISTLSQNQAILERCYAQNFSYNAACTALPSFPQTSEQGYYTITLSNLTATTYTLTATARGAQVNDTNCVTMRLDQANQKTAFDSAGSAQSSCWNP